MEWWHVAAATNGIVFVAYLAIAVTILGGVVRSGQVRSNPLAVATGAIFLTCAVHHGSHPLHMLTSFGHHGTNAMREAMGEWHIGLWDIVSAGVAIWYWSLRSRFPALVRGAAVFEDLRERQRHALDIHDHVVQEIATAKLALELGDEPQARASLAEALDRSKAIITELLGDASTGVALGPGDLRRQTTSGG